VPGQAGQPERALPGRGQLDGQRQTVQQRANPPGRCPLVGGGLPSGADGPDPVQQQANSGPVASVGIEDRQRCQSHQVLAADVQGLAAGRQDPQPGAGIEQAQGERRDGVHHVLAVVQHQQPGPLAEGARDQRDRIPAQLSDPERGGGDRGDIGCGRGVGETDQPRRVGVASGVLQSQPGLADTDRADHGHQAGVGAQGLQQRQLPGSFDERGQRPCRGGRRVGLGRLPDVRECRARNRRKEQPRVVAQDALLQLA
jgi:hypothetical protein